MKIETIETLVVAPDEVLVVKLPEGTFDRSFKELQEALDGVGLQHRYIVFCGKVEFSKVKL